MMRRGPGLLEAAFLHRDCAADRHLFSVVGAESSLQNHRNLAISEPQQQPSTAMKIMNRLLHLSLPLLLASCLCSTALAQQFVDVTTATGLVQEKKKTWGNPIWGDINNDGYLDLIVPDHGVSTSGGPFVYLNNGGNTFTDIRATSGIKPVSDLDDGDWHGYAFGDYNHDGNLDVYIAEGAKGSQGGTTKRDNLFEGNGDGTFTYVSDTTGLQTDTNRGRGAFFLDYNNDGYLDLFVKSYAGSNVLYSGNSSGTLTVVPGAAGLAQATNDMGFGSIMSFADYDNDGYMDVIITGDGNVQALYHNNKGTFTDVTTAAGMVPLPNGNGVSWGDYNNDGYMDLFIARGKQGTPIQGATLYRNNGDGTFSDVTAAAGLTFNKCSWNGVWGDYDDDGLLDLYVADSGDTGEGVGNADLLFHNKGDGTFTDVAAANGVALADNTSLHKGIAWADYNNDGFLDLIVKNGVGDEKGNGDESNGLHLLFKNQGNSNHFIKVNLRGNQSNLHGIGSRVSVTSTNGVVYAQNNGGGGGNYDSQGSQPLHFGIGSAAVATIKVTWPSGVIDTRSNVAANSTLTIYEGGVTPTPTPTPSATPTPTPTPGVPPGKLQNISTRVQAQTGEKVPIGGFIITGGTQTKQVLIRALGPSLAKGNPPITGVLADPKIELHLPNGSIVSNNNWRTRQEKQIMATGVAPTNDLEAAIVADLAPVDPAVPGSGLYTAVVSGNDGGSGIALVEVYDLDDVSTSMSQLANISTRGYVGTGENVMIGGIIIGPATQDGQILTRALGPSLSGRGIADPLQNPTLDLYNKDGVIIASNDDWQDQKNPSDKDAIEATQLAPTKPNESAILMTVPPGDYTAIVYGVAGTTGVALVEVYRLP